MSKEKLRKGSGKKMNAGNLRKSRSKEMKVMEKLKIVTKANERKKAEIQISKLHLFDCKKRIQIESLGGEKKWKALA